MNFFAVSAYWPITSSARQQQEIIWWAWTHAQYTVSMFNSADSWALKHWALLKIWCHLQEVCEHSLFLVAQSLFKLFKKVQCASRRYCVILRKYTVEGLLAFALFILLLNLFVKPNPPPCKMGSNLPTPLKGLPVKPCVKGGSACHWTPTYLYLQIL